MKPRRMCRCDVQSVDCGYVIVLPYTLCGHKRIVRPHIEADGFSGPAFSVYAFSVYAFSASVWHL